MRRMVYALLKLFHLLSIGLWVAGMGFTLLILRPALADLEPVHRLRVMHAVLRRFFRAVLGASLIALLTGFWMLGRSAKTVVQAGGTFEMPLAWTVMAVLGTLMVALFFHIRFALFPRLDRALQASESAEAAAALDAIRRWVAVNFGLGLVVVVVTAFRPFL
jgi:uncharacterized membrane protein